MLRSDLSAQAVGAYTDGVERLWHVGVRSAEEHKLKHGPRRYEVSFGQQQRSEECGFLAR